MSSLIFENLIIMQSIPLGKNNAICLQGNNGILDILKKKTGKNFGKRSLERRLKSLSKSFPELGFESVKKTYYWSWSENSNVICIPEMTIPIAVSFKMSEFLLRELMPSSLISKLNPYFQRADKVINQHYDGKESVWNRKVFISKTSDSRIIPTIKPEIIDVIYTALLENKRFIGKYKTADGKIKEYPLNPRGIVLHDGIINLVATPCDYPDVKRYLLHRFITCKLDPENKKLTSIANFKLKKFVEEERAFDVNLSDKKIELVFLTKNESLIQNIEERKLSPKQKKILLNNGQYQFQVLTYDSLKLRNWIYGCGASIEIKQPKYLRKEIGEHYAQAVKVYD